MPPPPPLPPHDETRAMVPNNSSIAKPLIGALSGFSCVKTSSAVIPSPTSSTGRVSWPPNGGASDPEVGAGCAAECAVVEIVSVTAVVAVPLTVTEDEGEKEEQLAFVGTPLLQARLIVPL